MFVTGTVAALCLWLTPDRAHAAAVHSGGPAASTATAKWLSKAHKYAATLMINLHERPHETRPHEAMPYLLTY